MKKMRSSTSERRKRHISPPKRQDAVEFTKQVLVTLFLSGLILSCSTSNQEDPKDNAEATSSKIQSVEIVQPQYRSFTSEVLITGTALPNQQVMLYTMESGYVSEIRKDIGDRVNKDEIIVKLENPLLDELLAESEAALKMGKADLLIREAALEGATAQAKSKQAYFDRLEAIYKKTPQLTPLAEVEKVEGNAIEAQTEVNSKKAAVQAQLSLIEALDQKLEIARKRYELLVVKAPFSGVVTQRFVDRGALLQSGLTEDNPQAIVELQEFNPIRLTVPLPESDIAAIHKGMEALITFPELPGKSFEVTVSRTAGALDPASKTMQVEFDIDNPPDDGYIRPGMYAKVLMQISSRDGVLSLPVTAQVVYQNLPFVLAVKDNKVERIPLRKGLSNKDYFEVLNPEITENSKVIIRGKGLVQPGQIVKPVLK